MRSDPEVEILTEDPMDHESREALRRASDFLAKVLDTALPIPGTRIRIGLDPIIGLLPGVGDALASFVGSAIVVMASQLQVPKIVMARMSLNILLNGVVGTIPVAGDFFSIWFRSNARNAELLRRHSASPRRASTVSDWMFVAGIILGTLAILLGAIVAILWLTARLWDLVQ